MAKLVIAILVTAAATLFVSTIFFIFFYKLETSQKRRKNKLETISNHVETITNPRESRQKGGTLKGIIVDEGGIEVLYVKKMEKGKLMSCFSRVWIDPSKVEEEEKKIDRRLSMPKNSVPIQEIPLLHDPDFDHDIADVAKPPPPPPPPPKAPAMPAGRGPMPPPPPPKLMMSSKKPPPSPRSKMSNVKVESLIGEGENDVQMKLKPLHWDKVNISNAEQSMVWNEINDGSLRFDDELIEELFGYTPSNVPGSSRVATSASSGTNPPTQIFILEPRKSQNTAIVLKSLAVSRTEVLDSLLEGQGLNTDILEKLTRISPTQEEITKIIQFNGNPTKLATAESFLYYTLKALPSAFIRISAMLFRSNYDLEILQLKESLQMLELGCKELRTRGIFFKLLEAILKAGNRMNAGTSRGDARGFNLNALRKLSYVKSTDRKTTLLHFVVEQVVRDEGKRYTISRSQSIGKRLVTQSSIVSVSKEERDKEYLKLGLPVLSGLNSNFSNVKKAANIDYDSFITMLPNLASRIGEIKKLVMSIGNDERGGFEREMRGFLEECDAELRVVKEEQARIMDIVNRTTLYYQACPSKEKGDQSLHLFVIVKDFLAMVDQASLDITKKIQKMNVKASESSPQVLSPKKNMVIFQTFQSQFMPDKHGETTSDPEDDF